MSRPYIARIDGEKLHRRTFDVLVLGGGIAGLTAAISAARRWRVGLLTKAGFDDTATFLAQGGIAAALGESDSPDLHFEDTVKAGAGLCDEKAVRVLVDEGPDRVRELMEVCPHFDRVDGEIVLGREGAHSVARVVHAGGDATGSEVSSALAEAARLGSRVQLYEDEFVIDLLTLDGRCVGALSMSLDDGQLTLNTAMVTVLATGGAGQVYGRTTNPTVATGDGIAMAYRAGAAIRDLEFVQFHPTGLAVEGQETVLLITEALRGEGAYLRNEAGERFMVGKDPRAELAARDVVVRAMVAEMRREKSDHVYLDARHLDAEMLAQRFPTVSAGLAQHGLHLATDLIPVAPVCHYFIGGVMTDVWGRSTVPGLYASGECSSTGVHGANRLASNSLLEGLVFSDRVVRDLDRYIGSLGEDVRRLRFALPESAPAAQDGADAAAARRVLTATMLQWAGVVRDGNGLKVAIRELRRLNSELAFGRMGVAEYETLNLLTLGTQIAKSALLREESRGVHLREDFPTRDDERWRRHITLRLPPAQREGPA
ncbi:MAG TPA: L-aspartate oxidase [Thermoleophilia bacterium]|nr:L-aspartate oxidase [Thermoleophilia bacterium]